MSDLKLSIAQLLIDNFKGATSKKASDMAIAIMAFVNADREREIESAFCGTPGTGECSCRKFADNPLKCDNRHTQPEATKPAQDLSAAILALPLPNTTLTAEVAGYKVPVYGAQHMRDFAMAALASPADALVAGDRVDAERYRFLRAVDPDAEDPAVMLHVQNDWGNWGYLHLEGEELDAAIDAARQAKDSEK